MIYIRLHFILISVVSAFQLFVLLCSDQGIFLQVLEKYVVSPASIRLYQFNLLHIDNVRHIAPHKLSGIKSCFQLS